MNMVQLKNKNLHLSAIILILLIMLAVIPAYLSAYQILLLGKIFMYIILTVSWVIFSGPTGYISLASAAFFGVGVYTAAILGMTLSLSLVILAGGLVSVLLALLVGAITLRLKGVYFTIFTFGLVQLLKHFILWWEINIIGTRGRFVVVADHHTIYYITFAIFVLLMLTAYLIRRSRYGLALRSIGEREEAAAHMGVNVTRLKIVTFAISAFFMGAVGAIMATNWTYVDPFIAFNPVISFMPVLMAIFGGMGQLYGPIIGAAFFTYLEEILITRLPYLYMLIFGAVMIAAILYLPGGLAGLIEKWRHKARSSPGFFNKRRKRGAEGGDVNA